MGRLDPDDPRPPFEQIAEHLRMAILSGTYRAGDKLPAHGEVMAEFGVARGTVKHAYDVLQGDGLIVTRQGQGAFVRTQAPPAAVGLAGEIVEIRRRLEAVERRLAELDK